MTMVSPNPSGIPKEQLMPLVSAFAETPGINLALFIAAGALLNKKTWDGTDYSTHWLKVADIDNDHLSDEEKIIGILHDVVEDSDWTVEDLEAVGFSARVCEGVRRVTKIKGEKYMDAVQRCAHDPLARKVKKRDNKHNMDLTRSLSIGTPKQQFLYPVSYAYLDAVEKEVIPVGYSIWKFLQMPRFSPLLRQDSWHYIAAETTETPPTELVKRFGAPRAIARAARKEAALTPLS